MKGFGSKVLASMLGTFLVIVLIGFLNFIFLMGIMSFSEGKKEIKKNTVLLIDLKDPIADKMSVKPDFSTMKFKKTISLKNVTDAIKKAKTDDKIKGIYLDLSFLSTGISVTEEIRNALKDFKTSGKFIIAHSDFYTYKSYYLASIADKVYLTPTGNIQFTGLSAQLMFFKSMLEKIGINPQIIRHGKYKSAVEPFMSDKISEANKEQTGKLLSSIWNTILKGIGEQRGISVDELNRYADELSVKNGKSAKKLNLADDLFYEDQVADEIKKKLNAEKSKNFNKITLADYIRAKQDIDDILNKKENNIAIIYASGDIVDGKGTEEQIGSETLAKAIRKARKDESVKAIVLRINSPGGSALASDVIWRETVLAREAKPFIVSMGNLAASGGYYIACGADTIVAQPTTLTGSIGVFGILFNAKELLSDIGITVNTVNTNTYSDIGTPARALSEYEKNVIQESIEDIYSTFISRVAEGRNLPVDSVDSIGQGRVWSGEDALKIGLVDVLGGLQTSVDIAAEKAGIKDYGIKIYPERDKFSVLVESMLSGIKSSFIKNELGQTYDYYEKIKNVQNISGLQARLPYYMEIK